MRSADVNGFTIGELRFPAGYVQAPFEPDLPTWPSSSAARSRSPSGRGLALHEGVALTMPWARRTVHDRPAGARIVIVKASGLRFDRLRRLRGLGLLARRLASELRARMRPRRLPRRGTAPSSSRQPRGSRLRPSAHRGSGMRRSYCAPGAANACASARLPVSSASRRSDRACLPRAPRSAVGEYGRRARIEWAAAQIVGATGRSPRSRPRQGSRIKATSRGCSGATSGRHPAGSGRSKAARRSRQGAAGVRSWGLRLEGGTMRARSASRSQRSYSRFRPRRPGKGRRGVGERRRSPTIRSRMRSASRSSTSRSASRPGSTRTAAFPATSPTTRSSKDSPSTSASM